MRYTAHTLALTLLFGGASAGLAQPAAPSTPPAAAATKPASDTSAPARRHDDGTWPTRTFHLKYAASQNEMNEIVTAMRTLLQPPEMTFLLPSQDAIVVHAFPDDMGLAQKLLDDLDHPRKSWRLTYTVTEMEGANRLGAQHYSMVMADGQQTTLKQVDRVPIAAGAYIKSDVSNSQTTISYQDVGMNFDATLQAMLDGSARLRSDAVQSSLADEKSGVGQQDPVFRHSEVKGEATLLPGKPLVLGSMDIPGSTHHLQIEVLMEPLP